MFKRIFAVLTDARCTTLSGTLVYFFIMSMLPFAFWLALLFGKSGIDFESILLASVFDGVRDVLLFIYRSSVSAASGVTVFLAITSLYSATNLFYHARKAGEILYDYHQKKGGFRIRLSAFVFVFILMLLLAAEGTLLLFGRFFFAKFLPPFLARLADYTVLAVLTFFLALFLQLYVSPYQLCVRSVLLPSALTTALWFLTAFGFSVYLRFADFTKLYGNIATLIVFLLWLYLLMLCFLVGVLYTERFAERKGHKKF